MKEVIRENELEDVNADTVTSDEQAQVMERKGEQPVASKNPAEAQRTALLPTDETEQFRARWNSIQTRFVDEPHESVEEADTLVDELMQRLTQIFSDERAKLEGQWGRGDQVSTEDLRMALRRYRSFFERLLSM